MRDFNQAASIEINKLHELFDTDERKATVAAATAAIEAYSQVIEEIARSGARISLHEASALCRHFATSDGGPAPGRHSRNDTQHPRVGDSRR